MIRIICVLFLGLYATCIVSLNAYGISFTYVDIGTFGNEIGGSVDSRAIDVNRHGVVTGSSNTPTGSTRAIIYSQSEGLVLLPSAGIFSSGLGINDNGDVIVGGNGAGGFIYWANTGDREPLSRGNDINNKGEVVGSRFFVPNYTGPYLYRNGEVTEVGSLGGIGGAAFGINESSDIVGQAGTQAGTTHAFLYTDAGGMQDLGTLGGTIASARSVNNDQMVVGFSRIASDNTLDHAFAYTHATSMIDLGTLGGAESFAYDVSDDGQIVGKSNFSASSSTFHAFYADTDGIMRDLNDLVMGLGETDYISTAFGISKGDRTYIAAEGRINGRTRGILLTEVVPIPPTFLLFVSGLGLLGWVRRKTI